MLITGCATLPNESSRAKMLSLPSINQTLPADPESTRLIEDWPKAQWWRMMNNPELNRLIETALQDSPNLNAAAARLQQSMAVADFQAAEMLPTLSANAEMHQRRFSSTDFYGPNGGKTFTGAYIDPAVFRYHLDIWGKDKAALEAALGQERAQASDLAMAKLLLSTAIARSYINLCTTTENLQLTQSLSEKAEAQLKLNQLRWQRGLSQRDPVYAAEQQLAATHQQLSTLRHQQQLLRNQIAMLAGKGPDWGNTIQPHSDKLPAHLPDPATLALGLLRHRPDVTAALWRVEAAAQTVKIAQTRFYPDVNLVGFAGLRSLYLKDLFMSHGASLAYGVGPSVSLPLFEGGRLDAELNNQQAGYDAAVDHYNQTLLSAAQQVADSVADWRQITEHDAAQEQALAAAEAENHLSSRRFLAGISSRDMTLEAEAKQLRQQLTSSEMHGAQLLAAIGLIEALGGGYEQSAAPSHILIP
jgi:NodT family efflux transporter outer membrane factor (OMF) lipoprotein